MRNHTLMSDATVIGGIVGILIFIAFIALLQWQVSRQDRAADLARFEAAERAAVARHAELMLYAERDLTEC